MERRDYIGGTDVSAILGLNSYSTIGEIWRRKRGIEGEVEANERMRWGLLLEPVILAETEARLGVVGERPGLIQHPFVEYLAGTPDLVYQRGDELVVVDAKWSKVRGLAADGTVADVDNGSVPGSWWCQLHHYAWLVEETRGLPCRLGQIAALTPDGLRIIDVPLDLTWWRASVLPRLDAFWASVQDGVEPSLPEPVKIAPPPTLDGIDDAVADYLAASAAIDDAEAMKASAKSRIEAAIAAAGHPAKSTAGGATISYIVTKGRVSLDSKRLEADNPELFAAYSKVGSSFSSIRVSAKGEKK